MKRLIILSLLLLLSPSGLQAQLLESITAKEILPTVNAKAQTEFASDAMLTNVVFFRTEFQGIALEMDITDGTATGWLYRFHSPALDSSMYYIGARVVMLGDQAVRLPLDTISQYLPVVPVNTGLVEPWVDSDAALQGSKDGGAETFLQNNPDARIPFAFVINNPVANRYIPQGSYWFFRYTADNDTLTCMVHAATALPFRCFAGNAPTILTLPKTSARIGLLYTYDVLAFGEPAPEYSLETAPAGMTIHAGTGRILWTPEGDQEGMHDVTVVATNPSGSDAQSFRINVAPASAAPEITSSPVTEAAAGKQYSYQVTASGTPPITYVLDEKPDGMLIEPGRGTVLWTPTRAQAGPQPIVISARNNAGSTEQRFILEVYKAPRIDPVPDQLIGPDKPFWYQTSTDARPDAAFALNAGPDGLHIDESSGMITWTPTDQQLGSHTVLFEARNRFGVDQRSFEIEVDATVGIEAATAAEFHLLPHYPDPVSTSLSIPVETGKSSFMQLDVFDLLGRPVTRQILPVGQGTRLTLTVGTATMPAGLYFYRIQNGAQQELRSFIVSH
jgi:hypothetical protein